MNGMDELSELTEFADSLLIIGCGFLICLGLFGPFLGPHPTLLFSFSFVILAGAWEARRGRRENKERLEYAMWSVVIFGTIGFICVLFY
jgi:hypothetical protein